MCGIAGVIYNKKSNGDLPVREILDSMKHRGPDFQNFFTSNKISFFHSRLSIIDLDDRSNQPFFDKTQRYVLVFNGEIYNYKELRSNLNYPFLTESDTEVLMAMLIEKGEEALNDLNGMFSFVFHDTLKNKTIIGRDPFGKKPLYYFMQDGNFYFSSEIRTLLLISKAEVYCDKQLLSNWFAWQTLPNTDTLIKDLHQLSAGSYIVLDDKNNIEYKKYWEIRRFIGTKYLNKNEIKNVVNDLIYNAVEKRIVSDVPFSSFLSGGLDSSIIALIGSDLLGNKLNTFTIGFEEKQYSEHKIAQLVAKKIGTTHNEFILKPDYFLENIIPALNSTDFPTPDGLNTYIVSKITSNFGFKMALSGIGGDEWFSGYPYFQQFLNINKFNKLPLCNALPQVFVNHFNFKTRKLINLIKKNFELGGNSYPYMRQFFDDLLIDSFLKLPKSNIEVGFNYIKASQSLSSILEMEYYTTPLLLKDSDQYSMASGLEIRCPFLDKNLVEFILGIDDKLLKSNKPKGLLIDIFGNRLPPEVFNRKKMGFTLPWEVWMKNELNQFCSERVRNFSERVSNNNIYLQWKKFQTQETDISWSKWWSIVSIEYWLSKMNLNIQ